MGLNTAAWSEQALEAYRGTEEFRMPLVRSGDCSAVGKRLMQYPARQLFPGVSSPEALLAGLLLHLNCWSEAHSVAQDLESAEGSYWHALIHRMEPDSWNSGYWFGLVSKHAIFDDLQLRAASLAQDHPDAGFRVPKPWNPKTFIQFCESAVGHPERERLAVEIQHAEWALLMEWCQR
jgi:hypothetical protein